MKEVRDPRARDGDRVGQEPVCEGPVATRRELQDERDREQRDLGAATPEVPVRLEVVRGDFPACRGEDLDDPEDEDDLGNLRGNGRWKEAPKHRHLVARVPMCCA